MVDKSNNENFEVEPCLFLLDSYNPTGGRAVVTFPHEHLYTRACP